MPVSQLIKHSAVLFNRNNKDASTLQLNALLEPKRTLNFNHCSFFSDDDSSQEQNFNLKKASDDNIIPDPSVHLISESSSKPEDINQLTSMLDKMRLNNPSHKPALPTSPGHSIIEPPSPGPTKVIETDTDEEKDSLSGIGTPFSELSEDSLDHSTSNEHYLSQLKNSAFSLFK